MSTVRSRVSRSRPATLRTALRSLGASAATRRAGGLRAALAIGIPLVAGLAAGEPASGGQAALGSFVAIYGADASYRRRAWLLVVIALALAAAMGLGTLVAGTSAVLICVVGGVVGFGATLGALALRIGPPREYFVVLTFLLGTTLPVDPGAAPQRVGLVLAGAAIAWLVAMGPWLLGRPGPGRAAVRRAHEAIARLLDAVGGPTAEAAGHDAIGAVRAALEATADATSAGGTIDSARAVAAELLLEAALALHVEDSPPLDPRWGAAVRALADGGAASAGPAGSTAPAEAAGSTTPAGVTGADGDGPADGPAPLPDRPASARLRRSLDDARAVAAGPHGSHVTAANGRHRPDASDAPEPAPDPRWTPPLRWSLQRGSSHPRVAARIGLAVLAGLAVGHAAGLSHPAWVAASAAAVLQGSTLTVARSRAIHRAVGTAIGVLVAGAIFALDPSTGVVVAIIVVLQFSIELVIVASYGLAVVAITPLVLLLLRVGGAGATVEGLLDVRLLDTVVGCAIAGAVVLATRPRRTTDRLAGAQAEALRAIAAVLVPAVTPGTDRHDLLVGRRRLHAALLRLRAAESDTIGDALRRDPRADGRWPVTATLERLARLCLALPTVRPASAPDPTPAGDAHDPSGEPPAATADRLRELLAALADRTAGGPADDPRLALPVPVLPDLPRSQRALEDLRDELRDLDRLAAATPSAAVGGRDA